MKKLYDVYIWIGGSDYWIEVSVWASNVRDVLDICDEYKKKMNYKIFDVQKIELLQRDQVLGIPNG